MPVYRCWNPEHGDEDDGWDVDAPAADRAVRRFAEWYDTKSSEYPYANNGGTVCVRLSNGLVARYTVTGERSITYYSRLVDGGGS